MQSIYFFMEYAEELSLLMDSVIIVLLLVLLHRIKSVSKWMQREAENTRESVRVQEISEKEEVTPKKMEGGAAVADAENVQAQTELITAVLDEVFL